MQQNSHSLCYPIICLSVYLPLEIKAHAINRQKKKGEGRKVGMQSLLATWAPL